MVVEVEELLRARAARLRQLSVVLLLAICWLAAGANQLLRAAAGLRRNLSVRKREPAEEGRRMID